VTLNVHRASPRSLTPASAVAGSSLPPYIVNGGFATTAEWSIKLQLGTPAQTAVVQLDTGSADFLVYGTGCAGCGPDKQRFNGTASNTYSSLSCSNASSLGLHCDMCLQQVCAASDVYGDGSWVNSTAATDMFSLGPGASFNAFFGDVYAAFPNFQPVGVNGIWGLAYRTISEFQAPTPFRQMVQQLGIYNGFSMCLRDNQRSTITFGDALPPNVPATNITNDLYYVVNIDSLSINGKAVHGVSKSDFGTSIVDSGTTLLILPTKVFNAVKSTLSSDANCKKHKNSPLCMILANDQYCYQASASDLAGMPTITFSMSMPQGGELQWKLTGSDYLINCQKNYYTLGVQPMDGLGTILGDVAMQAYKVYFDRQQNLLGIQTVTSC